MVEAHQSGAPSATSGGITRKAVNIVAMGSSRQDWFATQMVEQRPGLLIDAETWTINYMGAAIYCNRIIHVDPVHNFLNTHIVRELCDRALRMNIPFYTSWPHPLYPNHVIYPFDEVIQKLGVCYFNTSVAYAIALAVVEGYNEIGLFGCDFSYPDVHLAESGRACCEFLLGLASQRGVRVHIGHSSTILDTHCGQHPYGWFKDPFAPPVNGGALMNPQEIIAHVQKVRNARPPQSFMELPIGRPGIMQPFGMPPGTFTVADSMQQQMMQMQAAQAVVDPLAVPMMPVAQPAPEAIALKPKRKSRAAAKPKANGADYTEISQQSGGA